MPLFLKLQQSVHRALLTPQLHHFCRQRCRLLVCHSPHHTILQGHAEQLTECLGLRQGGDVLLNREMG